ncbi:MAG: SDR family oxidoreductase [Aridibacter sp.]
MKIKLKKIKEQVVVIFGAASGIGRQTALDFAEKGAKIAVASRSESGLKTLVEEITAKGGKAFYILADAANADEVQNVADKAFERYGRIDTWVHVAGTLVFAKFEDITPEEFKRVIEVNQLGQVYGAMAALKYLRKDGGALIHITSVEAFRTVPFHSAYGSSKHGVKGFLQALRLELEADEIPVSVTEIMPAAINTPIWDKARNKFEYKMKPPVPPIYHPKIVSDAILYSAENVVRDMVAGGGALGVPLAERFSPSLTDKITSLIGFNQFTDEKQSANPPDGLFEPTNQMNQIEGRFSDQQLISDPYTWAKTHPHKTNLIFGAIGGILGGVLAYKFINKNE